MNNIDLNYNILYEEFINRAYSKSGIPLAHNVSSNGILFEELISSENISSLKDEIANKKIFKIVKDCMEIALLAYLKLPLTEAIRTRIRTEYELFQYATTSQELLDIIILVLNLTD